jgi:hypothetical protein
MADEDPLLDELKKLVSSDGLALLEARDSAPKLIAKRPMDGNAIHKGHGSW